MSSPYHLPVHQQSFLQLMGLSLEMFFRFQNCAIHYYKISENRKQCIAELMIQLSLRSELLEKAKNRLYNETVSQEVGGLGEKKR